MPNKNRFSIPVFFSHKVFDFDIFPMRLEIFGNKASMTMFGLFFAAKQTTAGEYIRRNTFFDLPYFHQIQKLPFVQTPVTFIFFVGIKYVLGRR